MRAQQAWERTVLIRRVRKKITDELREAFGTVGRVELGLVRRRADGTTEALASGDLARAYDEARDSLLLLGPSGAGKSVALYTLAGDLLARAEREPTRAVPVVVNLCTWARHGGRLEAWLAEALAARYDVPAPLARIWVAEERVLPLLDGLDEVAGPARHACAEQVNAFRRRHGLVRLVVCSRAETYEALDGALRLHEVVELRPPERTQALGYLGRGQVRVPETVVDDLGDLLSSPLMLTAMALAYDGDVPSGLAGCSGEVRRTRVLSDYVTRMSSREDITAGHPPKDTLRWLGRLAQGMRDRGEDEFRLDRMQPDWLPRRYERALAVHAPRLLTVTAALALSLTLYAPRQGVVAALALAAAAVAMSALVATSLRPAGAHPIMPVPPADWHPVPRWVRMLVRPLLTVSARVTAPVPAQARRHTEGHPDKQMAGRDASRAPGHQPLPDADLRRSARHSAFAGTLALLIALPLIVVTWLSDDSRPFTLRLAAAVPLVVVVLVVPVALRFGGQAYCRHLAMRALLVREGLAPWRFGLLLREAAERRLLVRTGSGYRFPHRALMEHLAAAEVDVTQMSEQPTVTVPTSPRYSR